MDLTNADEQEQAVIGAMLGAQGAIDLASRACTWEDFRDAELGQIFEACVRLRRGGMADGEVDWLVISREAGTFRRFTVAQLEELTRSTPVAGNVVFYAQQVRDAAVRRRLTVAGMRILDGARDAGTSGEAVQGAHAALHEASAAHIGGRLSSKSWDEIDSIVGDAEYDWVVPGYLERRDRLVITGAEGLGKSTFLRQCAMMTAAGLNWITGKPIPPQKVLVIDVENSELQWKRTMSPVYQQIRAHGHDLEGRLRISCSGRIDITKEADLTAIYELIDQHKPSLLTIGPLYKLTSKGINNDDDAAPVIMALDSIRDMGIALVMETHMGHTKTATGDRDVRPRGSSAILGWPEFGAGLAPAQGLSGEGVDPKFADFIHWRGQRDARAWPEQFYKGGTWPWTPVEIIQAQTYPLKMVGGR